MELIEERERAIRQLEACEKKLFLCLVLLLVAGVVKCFL